MMSLLEFDSKYFLDEDIAFVPLVKLVLALNCFETLNWIN